jgi:hypothetical protein
MTATEIMTFIVGIVLYLVGSRRPQQAPVPDVAVR